jgi:biopolymer transport protein TolR
MDQRFSVRTKSLTNENNSDPSAGTFKPQLTSLIDVMTLLLAFLIMTFSVEGNLVTPARDLELPESASKKKPVPTLTIELSRTQIIAGGTVVSAVETVAADSSLLVKPLLDYLRSQPSTVRRDILIQADRRIEFALLKKIMFTCGKAGYDRFSVLVIENG